MNLEIFVYVLIGIILIESCALLVIIIMAVQKEKIDPLMAPCVDCGGQGTIRESIQKVDNYEQYRFISCESCKGSGYQFTNKGAEIVARLKKRGFLNG